jgi:hypothetical protein
METIGGNIIDCAALVYSISESKIEREAENDYEVMAPAA